MSETAQAIPLPPGATALVAADAVRRPGDPAPRPARDGRIDFWRGLCILGMVSWHLLTHPSYPRWLSFPVIQGFNFVAEGFVLLAGTMIGLKLARSGDWVGLSRSSALRAGKILLVHWAMVAGLAALFAASPLFGELPPGQDLPGLAWDILTLRYQPYLGDILSVFVFLFASLPLWLLLRRWLGDGGLVLASAALYAAALLFPTFCPINGSGAFVFNSWQIYFVLGLVFGARYERVVRSWASHGRRYLIVLVPLVAVAVAYRVAIKVSPGFASRMPGCLLDERHPLTLFRTAYILGVMLLLGVLTVRHWERFGHGALARWVVLVGQHSMAVFVASVFLDYFLKALLTATGLALPFNLLPWGAELALLTALAYGLSRPRRPALKPVGRLTSCAKVSS
jgi:hypothetical protein